MNDRIHNFLDKDKRKIKWESPELVQLSDTTSGALYVFECDPGYSAANCAATGMVADQDCDEGQVFLG